MWDVKNGALFYYLHSQESKLSNAPGNQETLPLSLTILGRLSLLLRPPHSLFFTALFSLSPPEDKQGIKTSKKMGLPEEPQRPTLANTCSLFRSRSLFCWEQKLYHTRPKREKKAFF